MTTDRIVAIALLTAPEVEMLGPTFRRLFPIDEKPCFDDLFQAIDGADRELSANPGPDLI